jgi:cytochrome c peroxidase
MRTRAISSASITLVVILALGACGHPGPEQKDEPAGATASSTTGTEQIASSSAASLAAAAGTVFQPIPATPPNLETNPMTPEKVELGKMLFFEPRLSASWLISCNTCHNLGLGGVDLQETSATVGSGDRGTRPPC